MVLATACFVLAVLASLSATEIVRVAALRLSAVDAPGGRRLHRRPTPRLGGLGIFWGFSLALLLATLAHPQWRDLGDEFRVGLLALLAGGGLMVLVGLVDDVRGLRWSSKLGLQMVAALVLYGGGWRVLSLGLPGVGVVEVGHWSLALTVGWVVFVTNAVNLIDGLDGLACGVALVASLAATWLLGSSSGPERVVAVSLAGALLGFLWFNINPALIFMGDAGSLFVGFLLAAVTLRVGQHGSPETFPLVPAMLVAVPFADTSYAIVRRALGAARGTRSIVQFLKQARARLFAPDHGHIHHLLIQLGLSPRQAVGLLWGAAVSFALSGCVVAHSWVPGLLVTAVVAALWLHGYRRIRRGVQEARRLETAPPSLAVPLEAEDVEERAA
jgi:UDP-GlcNAc:undecaprenyl-phosphate GlcNAc-1-phosphate transferase